MKRLNSTEEQQIRRRHLLFSFAVIASLLLGSILAVALYLVAPYMLLPKPQSTLTSESTPQVWALFQGDPARTGYQPSVAPRLTGELLWTYQTRAYTTSAPVVAASKVFLSTGDRRVIAINTHDGSLAWEFGATGALSSVPAVAGNTLYVGLLDGRVMALDVDTGSPRWEFNTGLPIISSPVVYKGDVLVGSGNSLLYAIDAVTGKQRWVYEANSLINAPPAVNDTVVAVQSADSMIHLLNRKTGRSRLTYLARRAIHGNLAITDNYVYAAVSDGRLLAIDWREVAFPMATGVLLRTRLQLFFWGILRVPPSQKGFVWVYKVPSGAIRGSPAVTPDMVLVGSTLGTLYSLNRLNGQPVWQTNLDSLIETAPLVIGDTVLIGTRGGFLYQLDGASGTVRQRWTTPGPLSKGLALSSGVIYGATTDGTLFAMR